MLLASLPVDDAKFEIGIDALKVGFRMADPTSSLGFSLEDESDKGEGGYVSDDWPASEAVGVCGRDRFMQSFPRYRFKTECCLIARSASC